MNGDTLVKMANQIGAFFEAMPDRDEAIAGIANHIAKFWEPRMRRELYASIDANRASALRPIVAEALRRQRASAG